MDRLAAVYRLSGKFPKMTKHGNPPVDKALRHFHNAVRLPPLFRYISRGVWGGRSRRWR